MICCALLSSKKRFMPSSKNPNLSLTILLASNILWEELDNYHPFIPCTCPAKNYHNQDFIIPFFEKTWWDICYCSLPSSSNGSFTFCQPIFSMVIQHECQLLNPASILEKHKVLFNFVDNRRPPTRRGRGTTQGGGSKGSSSKLCAYCAHSSHMIDVCYGKHGGCPRFHDHDASGGSVNSSIA